MIPATPPDTTPARPARVLGISGSPRKNGNSDILLDHILQSLQPIPTTAVHLRDHRFTACIGCEKCRRDGHCSGLDDEMQPLYPLVTGARGLVLISPAHNYNITAWMKAFIDRLYCFYRFDDQRPRGWSSRLAGQGRKALIATIGEQPHAADIGCTLDAMRLPLEALGYEIVDQLTILALFDRGIISNHPEILQRARTAAEDLARALD